MTIETLFKNLKKAVAYQERENSSFYEELGMRIKGYFLNHTYHSCSSTELTCYAEMTMLKSYLACIIKPNKESFTGLADAFLYDFMAFSVIPKDKEEKARLHIISIDMCHCMLGILTCLSPQDAKIAFECFLNVINYEVEMDKKVHYKNTLFPEVFILYDLLTDNNSSALLNKYIGDTPMHSVYKNFLQLIDSDNEDSINLAIDEMVDYHLMQCRNDTFQREFYSRIWRFIPVEIWAFLRLRVIRGKTISFVKNKMIKKSLPFLMQEKYELSPTAQSLKEVIYKNYVSNKVEETA